MGKSVLSQLIKILKRAKLSARIISSTNKSIFIKLKKHTKVPIVNTNKFNPLNSKNTIHFPLVMNLEWTKAGGVFNIQFVTTLCSNDEETKEPTIVSHLQSLIFIMIENQQLINVLQLGYILKHKIVISDTASCRNSYGNQTNDKRSPIQTSTSAVKPSILQILVMYLISRSGKTAAIRRTASAPLVRA